MVEHAPPLASIHDGNMLGGDDEGAPPMPALARTTALAQPAVSGPHKAHRRRKCLAAHSSSVPTPLLCGGRRRRAAYEAARRRILLQRSALAHSTQDQPL